MIYQIKIIAKNINSMNRTILIDSESSFEDLHIYTNHIFGLKNIHLYDFKYKEEFFINMPQKENNFALGISLLGDKTLSEYINDSEVEDLISIKNHFANKTKLSDIFDKIDNISYMYDFGSNWDFDMKIQKTIYDQNTTKPKLMTANGGNLIEDCGGYSGYNDLLEMIDKKKYDEDLFESKEDFEEYIKPILQKVVLDI